MAAMLIYKILLPDEWAAFEAAGRFDGSPLDRASGFIHCSSGEQVVATARGVFPDAPELVVVALDAAAFGQALRWEEVPGDDRFPHVYAPVPADAVVRVHRVAGAAGLADLMATPADSPPAPADSPPAPADGQPAPVDHGLRPTDTPD
jgi:uncharacterized protein (DUF952 family)